GRAQVLQGEGDHHTAATDAGTRADLDALRPEQDPDRTGRHAGGRCARSAPDRPSRPAPTQGRQTMTGTVSIRGKVVVITGGARGIGLGCGVALGILGGEIAIGDIDEEPVKESGTDYDFDHYGGLDVADQQSFSTFRDDVERELGPI